MFKWSNFSESLLVRSVYLITIPIVLVQIVGIVIFFELHWDLVLKKRSINSNEIKILKCRTHLHNNYANTLQIIRTDSIDLRKLRKYQIGYSKKNEKFLDQISGNFEVLQNQTYFIFFDEKIRIFYLVPKELKLRLLVVLWTIAVSIILSLISYLF